MFHPFCSLAGPLTGQSEAPGTAFPGGSSRQCSSGLLLSSTPPDTPNGLLMLDDRARNWGGVPGCPDRTNGVPSSPCLRDQELRLDNDGPAATDRKPRASALGSL